MSSVRWPRGRLFQIRGSTAPKPLSSKLLRGYVRWVACVNWVFMFSPWWFGRTALVWQRRRTWQRTRHRLDRWVRGRYDVLSRCDQTSHWRRRSDGRRPAVWAHWTSETPPSPGHTRRQTGSRWRCRRWHDAAPAPRGYSTRGCRWPTSDRHSTQRTPVSAADCWHWLSMSSLASDQSFTLKQLHANITLLRRLYYTLLTGVRSTGRQCLRILLDSNRFAQNVIHVESDKLTKNKLDVMTALAGCTIVTESKCVLHS